MDDVRVFGEIMESPGSVYIFYFIVELGRGTLWHLQRFLQYIKYIILEFALSTIFLLSPPSPDLRNTFNKYLFSIYIHLYTVFAPYLVYRDGNL
jgi:hypothetical protein